MSVSTPTENDVFYARPAARDAFLNALDSDDRDELTRLARDLVRCGNPLPGMTCDELGLPVGATYGAAARHILSHGDAAHSQLHISNSGECDSNG